MSHYRRLGTGPRPSPGKWWRGWGALFALFATPATAQTTSPAPDKVAVTIYRAPERDPGTPIDRDWLRGYALVTEQRTIAIPAGRSTVRFEGVAAGILAESAIVTGLPGGVVEKNLDAELLSPRNLFARGFGRPVILRRVIGKRIVEVPAIIRSGPDGAAILQTKDGFEAANCGPQSDSLVYRGVPPGLAAKPTLSIELDSPTATSATVTLSYLAWGFDWQANYVATLRPDGRTADLFAWVTLASSDTTRFPDAETAVVAGKLERKDEAPYPGNRRDAGELTFKCYFHPFEQASGEARAPPAPPAPVAYDIVVTGSRVSRFAVQEELGDLKLYRVPDRTDIAALAQKQVALLERASVPVEIVYLASIANGSIRTPQVALRAVNRKDKGLGLPLPAGPVAVFEPRSAGAGRGVSLLIGEGALDDKAIGEDVEVRIAAATQVTVETSRAEGSDEQVVTVRNANPRPIRFELDLMTGDGNRIDRPSMPLGRKNGRALWAVDVPANGTRTLRYRVVDED